MNAIVARTLILVAVASAGVLHLRLSRTAGVETHPYGQENRNSVQEASTNWPALRAEAKHFLANDLIARRRTLWEVAALFRAINNYPKDEPGGYLPDRGPNPMTFMPRTEEEQVVLQVIHFVSARLHKDNQRRLEEVLRLEKIFLDELERTGVILLPDPAWSTSKLAGS